MNRIITYRKILLGYILPIFLVIIALLGTFFQVELTHFFQRGNYYGLLVDKQAYDLELINQKGEKTKLSSFKNRYVFLYFGYLQCYSICSKSFFILYKLSKYFNRNDIQYVIVSIDPERDSFQDMKQFMTTYGENFYVLKPNEKNIVTISQKYGITIQHVSNNTNKYELDHTNYIFFIDKKGYIRFIYLNQNDDFKKIAYDIDSFEKNEIYR